MKIATSAGEPDIGVHIGKRSMEAGISHVNPVPCKETHAKKYKSGESAVADYSIEVEKESILLSFLLIGGSIDLWVRK